MSRSTSEKTRLSRKVIFRPAALKNYNERQQKDVWPHLKLPGYVPYLWLSLALLFLIALAIGIGINMTLAVETAVY